ncbi:sulfurtransferase TusD [Halioglobus japonicus]|uniref:Sulfurtransferase complex subunit TusD n=1 Tax=Halioglobus japonicus TaxID=930805 RepID=A0AAP8MFD5_9GAMM|nr:sulfurtransferase complex subunit TusD [Halioglobus japonicus]AQA18800.1 sulfurtransferase TusD [Halioglobus japonicus]PLW86831.1 sulfurtransferase complex subunit TusD [Halioglobus japonicus]GHD23826.1 sulfurtransferase TusD [Halioglobus japonicus]
MIYTLLVNSSPASGSGARSACAFAQAAIARGHQINRVFFLDEGTTTGSAMAVFPQDETDRLAPWVALADNHNVDLVLCISSALKRGMLDNTEAERYERNAATVHPAFTVSGLGQLVDAGAGADRLVTFGG